MSSIGDRLKYLRGATSQAQIARELGMKQPQYARYESGASSPSADVLIKMCDVFLCSADDILGTHRGESSTVNVANSPGAAVANGRNARASVGPNCEQCPFKLLAMEFKDRAAKLPRKR
jgi:transcriptional regulator with XRE-family HTH domain